MSGLGKKPNERVALTPWRRQREGPVRTPKELNRARHTHFLETAEGKTCQDTKRDRTSKTHSPPRDHRGRTYQDTEGNWPSEAHSLSGDGKGMDLSGHRKRQTERCALTPWRQQRKGFVRTQKETDRARHTHQLDTAEGGTCQDPETDHPSEAHSLPGDGSGRDLSGHRKRPSKAHSHPGDGRGRDLSGHRKKLTKQGTLTNWRRQREGLVRTQKEINLASSTHCLEIAEERTCEDKNKLTNRDPLTFWRQQREGLVRTWKEIDRARHAHQLDTAEGGTCQDTERDQASRAHSHPGDSRGRDWSGHRKKLME